MNRRRTILLALCAATVAPRAALAQPARPVVVGWLHAESPEAGAGSLAALKQGLDALGWKDGAQVVFEERWADGQMERRQALARELAARKPNVIVAQGLRAAADVAKAAPNVPIVMVAGADPVAAGLVASLARPGGMLTGVTVIADDTSEKFVELLLAAVPRLKRIGLLADPKGAAHLSVVAAARRSAARYSIEARFADAGSPDEIEPAISSLAKQGAQALIVLPGALLLAERRRIVKLALSRRWPVIAGFPEFSAEGALLTYGVDRLERYGRAAYYVDRILKGAKPGDLPIEQPTKFELVVNLKTAKALGLTIPQPFLMRADR